MPQYQYYLTLFNIIQYQSREAQVRTGIVAVSEREPNLLADLPVLNPFSIYTPHRAPTPCLYSSSLELNYSITISPNVFRLKPMGNLFLYAHLIPNFRQVVHGINFRNKPVLLMSPICCQPATRMNSFKFSSISFIR